MKRLVNLILILSFAFTLNAQEVFLNEINYLDNERAIVEIAAPSTTNIDNYTLHFYDANGYVYHTQPLEFGESFNTPETNSSPSDECIFRFIVIDVVVILLTEDKSGVALTDPYNSLVQFVTYGGSNVGQEGPAKNVVSENIGKQSSPRASLQLTGAGNSYDDFTWDTPGDVTAGEANSDQEVSCDEIGEGQFNLPVEWISFTAEAESKGIQLTWRTATEEDNQGFVLERSRNGFEFNEIANIAAKGTTEVGGQYQYFDDKPTTGDNYYRIAQIDGSGEKTYFRLLNVRFAANGTYDIFPNPAQAEFTIELPEPQTEVRIDIINAAGQIVKTLELADADIFVPVNSSDLPQGYYQIIVQSPTSVQNLPLVIH